MLFVFFTELDSQLMWVVVFEDLDGGFGITGKFVTNLQKQGLALSVFLLRLLVPQNHLLSCDVGSGWGFGSTSKQKCIGTKCLDERFILSLVC